MQHRQRHPYPPIQAGRADQPSSRLLGRRSSRPACAPQALSKTIRVVLTEKSKHFELKIKKENLEDTVQGFMEGVTKCFSLPQLCPFNAIIVYVKAILKRLEAHVYSKSKKLMPASLIAELEQIDVWIEACKMSMASSLYQTVSVSFS